MRGRTLGFAPGIRRAALARGDITAYAEPFCETSVTLTFFSVSRR